MTNALHLLVVDDSAMMRAMLRRAVAAVDPAIVVFEAGNGVEALQVIAQQPIDAMFTDINMPVMSGIELLREMQARDWSHIPSVVISTDGTEARHEEARQLNVRLYLKKPFSPDALQHLFHELSAGRRD